MLREKALCLTISLQEEQILIRDAVEQLLDYRDLRRQSHLLA